MPVRQRSPTNATTTLPEDPMAFQTIRGRNPDGSTTVYHVHESVLHGGTGGGGMSYNYDYDNNMMYGAQSAYAGTPYVNQVGSHSQYHQQQHQPYIVYAQRASKDDSDDESSSDDEETSPSSTIVPSTTQKRSLFRKCNRTSIPCVLLGIVMAISFIVGYVFMVESIVTRSRTHTTPTTSEVQQQHAISIERSSGNGSSSSSSGSSSNGNPQQPLMEVAQLLNLEPQYFVVNKVLQPVNAAEVPPSSLSMQSQSSGVGVGVGQPRSMSTATTTTVNGGVADGGVMEQQQQLRGVVLQQPRSSIGIPNAEVEEDGAAALEQQPQSSVMSDVSTTVDLEYPIGRDGPV